VTGQRSRQWWAWQIAAVVLTMAVLGAPPAAAYAAVPVEASPSTTATPTIRVTAPPRVTATPVPEPAVARAIGRVNLPPAASIGAGFRAQAEDADGDAPADPNGAGIDRRTPQDVVDGLVPIGCPGVEAGRLPLPAHAWQQTYRSADGRSAVALMLDYPTRADATDLVSTLGSMLAKCVAPAGLRSLTTAQTVATLAARSSTLVQDARHEGGPDASPQTWDESIVRIGNRVGMVVVERRPGAAGPDPSAVADGIRTGLTR